MSDVNQEQEDKQPKKVSLADAIKQKLEQKKQQQNNKANHFGDTGTKTMKSQNVKKVNNQRRRTGGS